MKRLISTIALAFTVLVSVAQSPATTGFLTSKVADSIAANAFAKALYPTPALKKSVDSATVVFRAILAQLNYAPPVIYTPSAPITLKSNTTYKYLTIDCKGQNVVAVLGMNVKNVHITHLRILNTPNMAIKLYGCTNVTIDSSYFNMVMFGVYAQKSITIKVNSNQVLNLNDNGQMPTGYLAHAIQFDNVTGPGNQMNYNRVENIAGVAKKPHDVLSIYQSSGLPGDSLQCLGNWIRGGQLSYYGMTASQVGATGIAYCDVSGSCVVVRYNLLVNPAGCGFQTVGSGTGSKADHNYVYIDLPAGTGMNILGTSVQNPNQVYVGYNHINVTDNSGFNGMHQDGEPVYWNPAKTPTPIDWNKNVWQDPTVTANILPKTIITMK